MSIVDRVKKWFARPTPEYRAMPGQMFDRERWSHGVGIDAARYIAQYALNPSVYTAISRIAESASAAALQVYRRDNPAKLVSDHPILGLLGAFGRPNETQDALEFLEEHFTFLDLAGNSFWFWYGGGQPQAVYILPPQNMRVVPGRTQSVDYYIYSIMGQEIKLDPQWVTHFRKPNPFNKYYGLPALESILRTVIGDNNMTAWNIDFFGDGVAVPAGMLVLPSAVPDAEMDRIDKEMNFDHGGARRKTRIVRADPGAVVYHEAGLKQRDMDFIAGMSLNEERILQALNMPTGLLAKASTEAHARVAERQLALAVQRRLTRTQYKLNTDAMGFWPRADFLAVRFEDLVAKHSDWGQQSQKIKTLLSVMSVDEVRAQEFNLAPAPKEMSDVSQGDGQGQDRGDNRTLPGA